MGPLRPDSLDEKLRHFVLHGEKFWHDGPIVCHYADEQFTSEFVLGMVSKTQSGWDAFDMQHTNAAQTGPHSIGHFSEAKGQRSAQDRAKQAVEEYWTAIG